MEVFTGDRGTPSDVVLFPDTLAPFSVAAVIPSDHQQTGIPPTGIQHVSQPPPQKLRPIRSSNRSFLEFPDPKNRVFDGKLLSHHCVESPELGVLSPECGGSGGTQAYVDSLSLTENGGGGGGSYLLQNTCSLVDNDCRNLLSEAYHLEPELSSSSESGSESAEASKGPLNRKRKKRTKKRLEFVLESMTRRVMQRQEQMYTQLIEMLETKEKERIIREEAWRKQEVERAKRDEQARAQETSRTLALISFIQKFVGHEIEIPISVQTSSLDKEKGEIHNKEDFKFDTGYNQEDFKCDPGSNLVEFRNDMSNNQEDIECDPSNRRWPKSEVQALIAVRAAFCHKFHERGAKGSAWEEVALGLSNMGYSRTAKKCKEKWENINKYYKRTMDNGKKRPENSKVCPYFNELDMLYKNGFITSGNAPECSKNGPEEQIFSE